MLIYLSSSSRRVAKMIVISGTTRRSLLADPRQSRDDQLPRSLYYVLGSAFTGTLMRRLIMYKTRSNTTHMVECPGSN